MQALIRLGPCDLDSQVLMAMVGLMTNNISDAITQINELLDFPGCVEPWKQARIPWRSTVNLLSSQLISAITYRSRWRGSYLMC